MSGSDDLVRKTAADWGRRVAETLIADVAVKRGIPDFYLLDDGGRVIAWAAYLAGAFPPELQPLVDLYFAREQPARTPFSELILLGGNPTWVRIFPYRAPGSVTERGPFALIVDVLAVRPGEQNGPRHLSPAT